MNEPLRDKLIEKIGQEEFDRVKKLSHQSADRSMPYLRFTLEQKQATLILISGLASDNVLSMMTKAAQLRLEEAKRVWEGKQQL